jgi:hypothetical protein
MKPRPCEPEKTPFPQTCESEASAAANRRRVRESLNEWDYAAKALPVQPELINIEFSRLAFCFMPQADNDPKLAHKMAWEFLEAGYIYFPPPGLSDEVFRARLQMHARVDDAELRAWKLATGSLISLSDACRADWCRHKTLRGLTLLLKQVGFPQPFFWLGGRINRSAYEVALQKERARRKELDAKRKRESRAKPLQ